jgi:hypothetical protein
VSARIKSRVDELEANLRGIEESGGESAELSAQLWRLKQLRDSLAMLSWWTRLERGAGEGFGMAIDALLDIVTDRGELAGHEGRTPRKIRDAIEDTCRTARRLAVRVERLPEITVGDLIPECAGAMALPDLPTVLRRLSVAIADRAAALTVSHPTSSRHPGRDAFVIALVDILLRYTGRPMYGFAAAVMSAIFPGIEVSADMIKKAYRRHAKNCADPAPHGSRDNVGELSAGVSPYSNERGRKIEAEQLRRVECELKGMAIRG